MSPADRPSPASPLVIEPIRAFKDNYIWCLRVGRRAVVVDPGEAAPVRAAFAADGLELAGILLTHHHNDHIGGFAELLATFGQVPVHGPRDPRVTGGPVTAVGSGDQVRLTGLASADLPAPVLDVLDVPGHTSSHIAFHGVLAGEPVLFSGDTLFSIGCGRMFEGTPEQMSASLDRLAALPPDTRVYCGHEYTQANIAFARAVEPGNAALERWAEEVQRLLDAGLPSLPSRLATERAANPFLRCAEPAVARSASAHAGRALGGPVEVFAELRAWKNVF
jgi:hydroxyacylglutathione hydrolase